MAYKQRYKFYTIISVQNNRCIELYIFTLFYIKIVAVFGNTNEFIKLYKESIPDITISKYNERLKLSNTETDYDLLKK